MQKTSYQRPEIRDKNNNIIQSGAYGKNTPFSTPENDGTIDYINNNLEALHDSLNNKAEANSLQFKQYTSLTDFGIVGNTTINALGRVLATQSVRVEAWLNQGALTSGITDLPAGYAIVHILCIPNSRVLIEVLNAERVYRYVGNMTQVVNIQTNSFRRYDGVAI